MNIHNRVVVLIDMDCFYCQVEEKLNPELKGKPIAVVQYNPWKGGGIIAVNYVARAMGVTRHMRGDEAKEKCPEIQLPSVPCLRGKADISKYRDAGKEVAKVLQRFTTLLERASIDEAYLDITTPVQERLKIIDINTISTDMIPNTFALGYQHIDELVSDVHNYGGDCMEFDIEHTSRLLVGAVIVSEIRAAVYEETGYHCSAGIAHNKILAKLICGMNKPNKQTILPKHSINLLYQTLPLKKVKHLGGKFGDAVCEALTIKLMGELQKFSENELQVRFDDKNGTWLYNIARGIDLEPVQARFNPKSIGCCKQLRGKSALTTLDSLKKWLKDLGYEIEDRLEKDALENNRTPKQMVVSFSTQTQDGRDVSSSRSYNFTSEDEVCGDLFSTKSLEMVLDSAEGCKLKDDEPDRRLKAPIKFLGISVGKFEDNDTKKTKKIKDYFIAGSSTVQSTKENLKSESVDTKCCRKIADKEHVFRKFFQITEKGAEPLCGNASSSKTNINNCKTKDLKSDVHGMESSLERQESFFAKFLNRNPNEKSTTPVCKVETCGDESNDTNYSGSTIDEEINKSMAMCEDDPLEVDRVSSMRQLLNTSKVGKDTPNLEENVQSDVASNIVILEPNIEVIQCLECGKNISLDMFDIHADYHLALKIRSEDREQIRNKVENKKKEVAKNMESYKKHEENTNKSIANFLVKIDETIPCKMCSECGSRVPLEKFEEHLDFHEAQRLSREINRPSLPVNSAKRKRKSASPLKKPKMQCKSIDLFFR
ncbi:DNApol-eta [Pieris brassicae]|uniref:DNApol-eta n=1 Tax=Pieris brassicae TaxID=7116 RepID=UPI001E661AE2|nr:DNApol-eta [Pieris brassicae]